MIELYVIIFCILMVIFATLGIIGNTVVIIVYTFDKSLRSFTNYFFANLSITDILIVLTCLPVAVLDLLQNGEWVLGEFICNFNFTYKTKLIILLKIFNF